VGTVDHTGSKDILVAIQRLHDNFSNNVDRIATDVQDLGRKIVLVAESSARLEGTMGAHIDSEELWRREVSERINLSDVMLGKKVQGAEERFKERACDDKTALEKRLIEAKTASDVAVAEWVKTRETTSVWGGRVNAILGLVAVLATIVAIYTNVAKSNATAVPPGHHHTVQDLPVPRR
jgi:hypothetical protein